MILTKLRDIWIAFGGDPSDDKEVYKRYSSAAPFKPVGLDEEVIRCREFKRVRMKPLKTLVRGGIIKITHMSDDGEFMRFKVVGVEGVEHGMWVPGDSPLQIVDCETIHANMVKYYPQLFEEVKTDEP